jgi:hypothetical protein
MFRQIFQLGLVGITSLDAADIHCVSVAHKQCELKRKTMQSTSENRKFPVLEWSMVAEWSDIQMAKTRWPKNRFARKDFFGINFFMTVF